MSENPPRSPALTANAVHREQVWAALIHAVDFLLEETLEQLEEDLRRAYRADNLEGAERLQARARVVGALRREVSSPPP